ncbi:hypothetical protein ANN_01562 [Periplaneta americana]|uniref:Uncharacterized protein n=1 Tax=Periplaneta americana TaxID=6978 RepID=A0ABQ8TWX4_PERAM|nr:hypothetical protein ANN_01562 [Periplaneta americana]
MGTQGDQWKHKENRNTRRTTGTQEEQQTQGEQQKHKKNNGKTRRSTEKQGEQQEHREQQEHKENNRNTRRTTGTQGEQQKQKENSGNTRRTTETEGEQREHKENNRNTRSSTETQGEEQKHKENNRNTRRTTETQEEQREHNENNGNTRRTMETQGEQLKYKENKGNTGRTTGTQGERQEHKENNGNTRRTTGTEGEQREHNEKNGNIKRTTGTQGEQQEHKDNDRNIKRTTGTQGEQQEHKENVGTQEELRKDEENNEKTRRTRIIRRLKPLPMSWGPVHTVNFYEIRGIIQLHHRPYCEIRIARTPARRSTRGKKEYTVYEPSISFYKDKYHLESIVITGLMIGSCATIPRFLVDFFLDEMVYRSGRQHSLKWVKGPRAYFMSASVVSGDAEHSFSSHKAISSDDQHLSSSAVSQNMCQWHNVQHYVQRCSEVMISTSDREMSRPGFKSWLGFRACSDVESAAGRTGTDHPFPLSPDLVAS